MKAIHSIMAVGVAAMVSSCCGSRQIVVTNQSNLDRNEEIVEVNASAIKSFSGTQFKLVANDGSEVPYQITHDGNLIFPATVKSGSKAKYHVKQGTPATVDSLVYGRFVPERKDDMAWENDRGAFRAYGPALQASGERAFGYDIWTKSVPTKVLDQRYYDDKVNHISFHVDHGKGMDVYAVGPTLGGGTAALLNDAGEIVYPYCYTNYEVLDNGPLRFTVKLTYGGETVDNDNNVVESRLISLDKGSFLNRTTVSYEGLSSNKQVAPGIVVHKQNPNGYTLATDKGYMAYADLTENANAGNGTIFVGIVSPDSQSFIYQPLTEQKGDAIGHILAPKGYHNGEQFTYWWGSGWSKGGMPDSATWNNYLENFAQQLKAPLKIEVK
jgi:hypothetical protein